MRICILSRSEKIENRYIETEAIKRGHTVSIINPIDLVFEVNKDYKIYTTDGVDLLDFDCYVLRVCKIFYENTNKTRNTKTLIAKFLKDHGKIVVDSSSSAIYSHMGKSLDFYELLKGNIPIVPTVYIESDKFDYSTTKLLEDFTFPMIIKDSNGSMGRNIFKVNSFEEINNIVKENPRVSFLIQPFLEIQHDIRVFIVGSKILGAMEKIHAEGDFKGNISRGAVGVKYELTKEQETLALMTCLVDGLEIAGVDLAICGNKTYVLEVNKTPQFKGFIQATGINVAREIVMYLEERLME